jgi:4-amino-4-deoxy-L-arabinose transferase-like glycosyltransferase
MSAIASRFRRVPTMWLVAMLWFLCTVPAIFIHGAHLEEGGTIGLARGAFEDGHWISPYMYGVRFVERPVIISWMLGALAKLTGSLDLWVARLPTVTSILIGAWLIHWLVRRYASPGAALFGAVCFLVSPMVLQKNFAAEPDAVVSTMLFAALVMWWIGYERGGFMAMRWFAVGCLLSIATLVKGPQPLGYFFLGVGGYLLLREKRSRLLKLAATAIMPAIVTAAWYLAIYQPGDLQVWLSHSRADEFPRGGIYLWDMVRIGFFIAIQWLPGLLLAVPTAYALSRRNFGEPKELTILLLAYAGFCTMALVLWPGANARYSMPGLMGLAAAAGFGFERFRASRPTLIRWTVAATGLLVLYGVMLSCVAMPLYPDRFREKTLLIQDLTHVVAEDSRPIYVTPGSIGRDLLVYIRRPVQIAPLDVIWQRQGSFWAVMSPPQEQAFRIARPDLLINMRGEVTPMNLRLLKVQ